MNKMAAEEKSFRQKIFISPYSAHSRYVVVKMNGVNYKFRIVGVNGDGIGLFQPVDPTCAKYQGEAPIEQRRAYLDVLPSVRLILSYETDKGWVSYPFNAESSENSIGLKGQAVVKNVNDCERFDVVVARYDGMHLWFDDIFSSMDHCKSEAMRDCFIPQWTPDKMQRELKKVKGMSPEDKISFELAVQSWMVFQQQTTEARLQSVLNNSGGTLGSYVVRDLNIDVEWTDSSGKKYSSVVNKESFDVVCTGICLDGADTEFHLKDLPHIVDQGEYKTRDGRRLNLEDEDDFE